MPRRSQSVLVPRIGQFVDVYKLLEHDATLKRETPVILCEGDSWFSTPLAMNLIDWLVWPPEEWEQSGPPVVGRGGLFLRAEESGHHASENTEHPGKAMFVDRNIAKVAGWHRKYDFDLVLLSGGGNDFVAGFLKGLYRKDTQPLTVDAAFQRVVDSGKYGTVLAAYDKMVGKLRAQKPNVPILAHTYDYPRMLGKQADFTLANIGAIALFAKGTGPWIGDRIERVLPALADKRKFTKRLIDGFVTRVLDPLKQQHANFDYVDFRGQLSNDIDWFDEMHPTGDGFKKLAAILRERVRTLLPAEKRMPGPQ